MKFLPDVQFQLIFKAIKNSIIYFNFLTQILIFLQPLRLFIVRYYKQVLKLYRNMKKFLKSKDHYRFNKYIVKFSYQVSER